MHFGPPATTSDSSNQNPAAPAPDSAAAAQDVDKPPPRTLRRVPPRVVNVNVRLADSIPVVEAREMPLADFLSLVSDLSTIPISIDADAVAGMGQSFLAPVQLKLQSTTVADVLEAALEGLKLGYQVQDGQLIVGYPSPQNLREVKYALYDFVGTDDQLLNPLGEMVRRLVAPQSWQQNGGPGTMKAKGGALLVQQTDPVHTQLLIFFEKLRVARGLPLRSHYDPGRFVLTTRTDKARPLLQHPITANFGTPQSLAAVVKWLHQTTGATILIDHAALARQETSIESECAAVALNQPLASFLDELLTPIDLAWRAIDERTLEITTREAAATQMELEFYPVRDQVIDAAAGQALVVQIESKIGSQVWGDKPDQAAILFDAPSRTLIVRAPQKVQAKLAGDLDRARNK